MYIYKAGQLVSFIEDWAPTHKSLCNYVSNEVPLMCGFVILLILNIYNMQN